MTEEELFLKFKMELLIIALDFASHILDEFDGKRERWAKIIGSISPVFQVGLWRSWERASMAWKRSSVRSRPGPPNLPVVLH